jgi:phosphate transport system protein
MSNARKASMVRLRFQQSLDDLEDRMLVMAGMAKRAVQRAIRGLPNLVALGEQAIDHLEREVDQMALDLLATEHLLASDLRSTLSVIKLNGEPRTGGGTDLRSQVQPAGDR